MALTKLNVARALTGATPVANGGTALTSGFVNGGGLTMVDQWRLTSNVEDSQDPIYQNLGQATGNGAVNLGSSMTQSGGVFTFPSTGIYLIIATGMFDEQNSAGANVQMTLQIKLTTNNSSYSTVAYGYESIHGTDAQGCSVVSTLFDVTDTTNCKVKFASGGLTSGNRLIGNGTANTTNFQFIRLGDT